MMIQMCVKENGNQRKKAKLFKEKIEVHAIVVKCYDSSISPSFTEVVNDVELMPTELDPSARH